MDPNPVRSLTDEQVLRALMRHRRLTRAELAAEIGISKPTAGESVRRLTERGLVADTGERTPGGRGMGRVGQYYALADPGSALVIGIAPTGIAAELIDAYGNTLTRASRAAHPSPPAEPSAVVAALREVALLSSTPPAVTPSQGTASAGSSSRPAPPSSNAEPRAPGGQRSGSDAAQPGALLPGATDPVALLPDAAQPGALLPGATEPSGLSPDAAQLSALLPGATESGGALLPGAPRPRLAVVSAADPVDRASGRLVHLPDAPFLVGSLDPVAVLEPYVDGPIIVDNDVNWAARAEPASADDFAYLFLGEGLGCAIVSDGSVQRGRTGLAGEIAHILTTGVDGRATPFIEVFRTLGLRQPSSSAIDVPALIAAPAEDRAVIAGAVAGVIAAVVALSDPAEIVVGGAWGPALLLDIIAAVAGTPRPVPLRATKLTEPSLAAARQDALDRLRTQIVDSR